MVSDGQWLAYSSNGDLFLYNAKTGNTVISPVPDMGIDAFLVAGWYNAVLYQQTPVWERGAAIAYR